MKKSITLLSLFVVVALLASCDSLKSDAKKIADKTCECTLLAQQDMSDMEKIEACANEIEALGQELDKKYTTKEDQKAFLEAYTEALKSCKAEGVDQMVKMLSGVNPDEFESNVNDFESDLENAANDLEENLDETANELGL